MKLRDDPQLSCAGRTAGMPVRAAGNSELHCGLVRVQHLRPRRAQRRPSTDRVGVLAGARPADGPNGCSPSAPSWRRSAGRSSLLRRRIRYCSHTSPAPRISTTQPDIRLHYPSGRRPSDAALEPLFDGCQAAALGSSVVALRSSRRPPCACRCVRRCVDGAAHEVRTAAGRRAS